MLDIKKFDIPDSPGVYIFRGDRKKVLYVGKAISLKNRVKSYFANVDSLAPKTRALVGKVEDIDFIKVENELEALLLEADLIKRYRPPYNIDLKDDKFYKYIKIDVHCITTTRKPKADKAQYFGPYPEGSSINMVLRTLRKIFPYRDCSTQKFNRYKRAHRPCLYGHIGLCPAPCQGDEQIDRNNENIKKIRDYLKGGRKELFNKLERQMKKYSKEHEFEKAAILRDQLEGYEYLTQNRRNIKEYLQTPSLVNDKDQQGMEELARLLNVDYHAQFRIEFFDISNIQGKSAVGSMVVLVEGTPDKSEYRRFRIKTKKTPDDFSMMKEVLSRRFKKKDDDSWTSPDLIVIDGGKGQLSAALEVLSFREVNIPTIGLAKREEEIVVHKNGKFEIIKLPKNSPALRILKHGRDESHRFAISYYRRLHRKKLLS